MTIGTAQPARHFQAAFAGQHEVQHHELVVAERPGAARLAPVAGGGHAEPVALEKACQQVADFAIIIDHENMRHGVHAITYTTRRPA